MRPCATVSVTGTHGKTTTTSLIADLFKGGGLDPTVITGGIINDWGSNARIGKGEWMVVEADESDGTFIKLPTQIGVVTNIDPEHLDYWPTSRRCIRPSSNSSRPFPSMASPSPASIIRWCASCSPSLAAPPMGAAC